VPVLAPCRLGIWLDTRCCPEVPQRPCPFLCSWSSELRDTDTGTSASELSGHPWRPPPRPWVRLGPARVFRKRISKMRKPRPRNRGLESQARTQGAGRLRRPNKVVGVGRYPRSRGFWMALPRRSRGQSDASNTSSQRPAKKGNWRVSCCATGVSPPEQDPCPLSPVLPAFCSFGLLWPVMPLTCGSLHTAITFVPNG
jgi:hypothetical protein